MVLFRGEVTDGGAAGVPTLPAVLPAVLPPVLCGVTVGISKSPNPSNTFGRGQQTNKDYKPQNL